MLVEGRENMKPWMGRAMVAALILGGLSRVSVPASAGDSMALPGTQERDARRQEWMRAKWEQLMAQARAQQDHMDRWHQTRSKQPRAQKRTVSAGKTNQIAADLNR
jgi:hypothetical protein